MTETNYDVIIVGAGSAGYPAGMYASRYNLKNLIIGGQPGGALATSHKVENWPGVKSAPGKEIMDSFKEHAQEAGTEIINEMVTSIEKENEVFTVKTSTGKELTAKRVVVATGNNHRHLGVEGEDKFMGKGVSYCATCDGMFFKGRDIIVAGGGNTAVTEALYLSDIANKVYLVHRRDTFRAEDIWVDKAKEKENIEFVLNDQVEEVVGDVLGMTGVKLKSGNELKADGIFVAIGTIPNTSIVDNLSPEKDEEGCLVVDARQETTVKGLYAAGDVTTNSNKFKQTIMSAAEGCLAADSIHSDLM